MARIVATVAKIVLILAAVLFTIALAVMVAWWRLVTWPYRKTSAGAAKSAQLEAGLALVTAVGALAAALRNSPAAEPVPAARTPRRRPAAEVRVRGVVYTRPMDAYVAADEIEANAENMARDARDGGREDVAERIMDRATADAERLREWARSVEE